MKNLVLLSGLSKFRDHGLLVIRVGLGVSMMIHGWPKISGGPERWEMVGGAMGFLGLDFGHVFFGFLAAVIEFFGGILLAAGLATRLVAGLLLSTMLVAAVFHVGLDDPFNKILYPLELGVVFAGLLLTGAGRFSVDSRLEG